MKMSSASNPSRSNLDLLAELSTSRLIDAIERQQVDDALKEGGEQVESNDVQGTITTEAETTALTTQTESYRMSLIEFVKLYPCYPKQSALCYKVFTDLTLKNELDDLKIEDGALFFDNSEYFLCGKVRTKRKVSRKRKSSELAIADGSKAEDRGEAAKEDKEVDQDNDQADATNEENAKMRYIFPIDSNSTVDLMW